MICLLLRYIVAVGSIMNNATMAYQSTNDNEIRVSFTVPHSFPGRC